MLKTAEKAVSEWVMINEIIVTKKIKLCRTVILFEKITDKTIRYINMAIAWAP